MVFDKLNKWSTAHRRALNYEKPKFTQFNISISNTLDILINHGSKIVNTINNTKFCGFTLDNTIN